MTIGMLAKSLNKFLVPLLGTWVIHLILLDLNFQFDRLISFVNFFLILGDHVYQQGPKHYNSIVIPPFNNKAVELKPTLLSLIGSHPFAGMDHEDPYTHLSTFMELCSTVGASDEDAKAVNLRAFSFSLVGKAKTWLQSHPNKKPQHLGSGGGDIHSDVLSSFKIYQCKICHRNIFPRIWWTSLWDIGEIQSFVAKVPKP